MSTTEYKVFYKDVRGKWQQHFFEAEHDIAALTYAHNWAANFHVKQFGLEKTVTTRIL